MQISLEIVVLSCLTSMWNAWVNLLIPLRAQCHLVRLDGHLTYQLKLFYKFIHNNINKRLHLIWLSCSKLAVCLKVLRHVALFHFHLDSDGCTFCSPDFLYSLCVCRIDGGIWHYWKPVWSLACLFCCFLQSGLSLLFINPCAHHFPIWGTVPMGPFQNALCPCLITKACMWVEKLWP